LIEHAVNSKTGCPICREKLPTRKRKIKPLQLPQDLDTDIQSITVSGETFEVREQIINGLLRLVRIGPLGGNVYTLDTHIEIGFYNVFTSEFYHLIETIVTLNGILECVRRMNINGVERYVSAEEPYIVYDINTLEEIVDIMQVVTPVDIEDVIAQLD
jgi:hypothetical protein